MNYCDANLNIKLQQALHIPNYVIAFMSTHNLPLQCNPYALCDLFLQHRSISLWHTHESMDIATPGRPPWCTSTQLSSLPTSTSHLTYDGCYYLPYSYQATNTTYWCYTSRTWHSDFIWKPCLSCDTHLMYRWRLVHALLLVNENHLQCLATKQYFLMCTHYHLPFIHSHVYNIITTYNNNAQHRWSWEYLSFKSDLHN